MCLNSSRAIRIFALAGFVLALAFIAILAYPRPLSPAMGNESQVVDRERLLLEYLDILNQGDPGLVSEFLSKHYDPTFLKRLPLFVHIPIHLGFHYESAGMGYQLHSTDVSGKKELSALLNNKLTGAWMRLRLPLAANPPYRISGFPELKLVGPPDGVRFSDGLSDEEMVRRLEKCMAKLAEDDAFAGAVLIAKDGEPLFKKAYGLASKSYQVSNQLDTKFNIASMGKMFTGVAVSQLVEQGKLSFDDPLDEYLPKDWLKTDVSQKIQIRHLLTHTSGLGDYFRKMRQHPSPMPFRGLEDYKALVVDESLSFEPGTKWSYSNTGMLLLGVVIEQVTGQSYFDYVRNHIYQPSGMVNTDAYEKDHPVPNRSIGYMKVYSNKGVEWISNQYYSRVVKGGPSGGSYSSVEDLLRFAVALQTHKLLSPEYTDLVLSPKPELNSPSYGYGFNVYQSEVGRIAEHGGDGTGIESSFRMYLDSGYVVAVLSNYGKPAASIVDNVIHQMIVAK